MKQQKQEWEVILGRIKEQEAAQPKTVAHALNAIEDAARKAVETARRSAANIHDIGALYQMTAAWEALVKLVEATS